MLIIVDIFTIYVAETNNLQDHQEQHNPAGSKLVDQSHPVDSGLDQTHTLKHGKDVETS